MTYYIASDHAGLKEKSFIKDLLEKKGFIVADLGPDSEDRVDYPDYAKKVAIKVLEENAKGILICGTGIGMSLTANKFPKIRAALCHNEFSAKMAREHNDANILCLGARVSGFGMLEEILNAWLGSEFEGGRHLQRVEKIDSKVG